MTEQILYERRGPVAYVTFNRPQARNAMTWEMYEGLHECCERVDAGDARVMVLRGAGEKAFVAGTDITQFRDFRTGADGLAYEERMERVVGRLERVTVPTVAAVRGYAVGGGLTIAAVCDLRICSETARFGVPIARTLGNCLSMENYGRLVALLGPARTKALVYLAGFLSAEEALAAGFATEVVEDGRLEERVEEVAATLAGHAPITLRVTKEAIRRLQAAGLPPAEDLIEECYASRDFRRGVEAFVAKRQPEWTGN